MAYRIAVDIGGTFTDVAVLDETSGEIAVAKRLSTPRFPANGVLDAINETKVSPKVVTYIVHGTTVGTNTVIQRKAAKVGLITTRGFRDVIEIMEGNRPAWGLFDIQWEKPQPLVPRNLRFEVTERIDHVGRVLKPLNVDETKEAIRKLKELGAEAVAVSFLFSFMHPEHEEKVREFISQEFPEAAVSISSEVNPEIREYGRTNTTVIDASIKPIMRRYLGSLDDGLQKKGFNCPFMIMRSSGGMMTSKAARDNPVQTIESGPAAGVIGSAFLGDLLGNKNLIAIDMGGTTFKVSLIDGGLPRFKSQGEVEWGVQYRIPMIDLSEIGNGGGSIAWIDKGGLMKVGPMSAGAEPGPVCYRAGGTEPTFTDANIALGRLNPDYILGGAMKLDKAAAEKAINEKVAKPLGLDLAEAAMGIIEISNANMLGSMRIASIERGYDPREFDTVAYGGAGPMVASTLAKELGCRRVIIPTHPGIFSAIGMLAADLRLDFIQTYISRMNDIKVDKMNMTYQRLEERAKAELRGEYPGPSTLMRAADVRYLGQNYEVTVTVPSGTLTQNVLTTIANNFNQEHKRLYGHYKADEPMEIVTLRTTIIGAMSRPKLKKIAARKSTEAALKSERQVYFPEKGGFVECNVYDRALLGAESSTSGPCVLEEMDSTILVNPSQEATIDSYGNVIIET
jgi:N-methylhydantoinase A